MPSTIATFPTTLINGSLSASGSGSVENLRNNAVYLTYNVSSATSSPNLTFTITEADPLNPSSSLTGGQSSTTAAITSASSGILALNGISSSAVNISWTISGGTFGSAHVAISEKFTGAVPALSKASISVSSSGNNTLISGVSGQSIKVFKMFLVFGGAANATFQDGSSTALTGAMPFLSNGSIVLDLDSVPWFTTSAGNAFVLNLSTGVTATGTVYYTQS